jgi:hypothetical protein
LTSLWVFAASFAGSGTMLPWHVPVRDADIITQTAIVLLLNSGDIT